LASTNAMVARRPSSLMVVEPNDALLVAAKELDAKLQAWPQR
jgi:hypothetical protein